MALKTIITIPDARLRQISAPIESVTSEIRRLADDMFETMYDAPGVGLAAIQIAVPKRMFVIDVARKEEPKTPICFINPEIISVSQELNIYEEGCLSIPEYYHEVERPKEVTIKYLDLDGKEQVLTCDDLLATCVQHELDHLNGALFIDYISKLKRDRVMKKYTKLAKEQG